MTDAIASLETEAPVLIFGGPYGNLQALEAVWRLAEQRRIRPQNIICNGDLAAYCAHPAEVIEAVRSRGIHIVMGNCDAQVAAGADDCGCGFPEDSACARLSTQWYAHAMAAIGAGQREWLGQLPTRIDLVIGGVRLAVVHATTSEMNAFVFATTSADLKRDEIVDSGCNGIVSGHCGLPFTQIIDSALWHNSGVLGMPANDGTPRCWCSVLSPIGQAIAIEHVAVHYDHVAAARAMDAARLPAGYRDALLNGLWPSLDVLPQAEVAARGLPMSEGTVIWQPSVGMHRSVETLWPATLAAEHAPADGRFSDGGSGNLGELTRVA